MKRKSILMAIGTCAVAVASADVTALDHFEAICDDVRIEGYRYDVGTVDGKVYSAWSKDDSFGGPPWRIR